MLDYENVNEILYNKNPNLTDWDNLDISKDKNSAKAYYYLNNGLTEIVRVWLNGYVDCSKDLLKELEENNNT